MSSTRLGNARHSAILLLGPTGSGKTPLGDLLDQHGLGGARCLHFDFGANLRRIAGQTSPRAPITQADLDFLRQVLQSGSLLEDEQFPLAQRILESFLTERKADKQAWIVLNGLPRHVGQAEAMDRIVDVKAVVSLQCSGDVVLQRIRSNVGGDRTGRVDDHAQAIRDKVRLFDRRTAPLVEHYRARQVPILCVEVMATTTPEEMRDSLRF